MALFKYYGREAGSRRLTPLRVVEQLDVVEDIGTCVVANGVDLSADALSLGRRSTA